MGKEDDTVPSVIDTAAIDKKAAYIFGIMDAEEYQPFMANLRKEIEKENYLKPLDDETEEQRTIRQNNLVIAAITRILERDNVHSLLLSNGDVGEIFHLVSAECRRMYDAGMIPGESLGSPLIDPAIKEEAHKILDSVTAEENADNLGQLLRIFSIYNRLTPKITVKAYEDQEIDQKIDVIYEAIVRILKEKGVDAMSGFAPAQVRVNIIKELKEMNNEIPTRRMLPSGTGLTNIYYNSLMGALPPHSR